MTEENQKPERIETPLRMAVRFYYDAQKLRIQFSNRATGAVKTTQLTPEDKAFCEKSGDGLETLEKETVKELKRLLKGVPIWEEWLTEQKGIGPTLGAVLASSIDIRKAPTASALWRYCGLAVIDGHAERRKRGERTHFDPWLKAKLLDTMGKSFLKCNSPWKKFYDDRKTRRQNQLVTPCMLCLGKGRIRPVGSSNAENESKVLSQPSKFNESADHSHPNAENESMSRSQPLHTNEPLALSQPNTGSDLKTTKNGKTTKEITCYNCDGKGNGPWGKGDAHREIDARRYMVKMFLLELWTTWRTLEGLEVRVPYAEEYLGRKHHSSEAIQP